MLGIQGSGKGTQAKLLSRKLGIPHISSGDLLRKVDTKSELGKKIRSYLDKGQLVPNDLTNELLQKRLNEKDCRNGVILDGYPRNLIQASIADEILQFDHVIYLNISDQEAVRRNSGRRICSKSDCGAIYNVHTTPKPQKEGICDICGSSLLQLKDDTKEVITQRVKLYHQQSEGLIQYYMAKGILKEINGRQPIEKVRLDICRALGISPTMNRHKFSKETRL